MSPERLQEAQVPGPTPIPGSFSGLGTVPMNCYNSSHFSQGNFTFLHPNYLTQNNIIFPQPHSMLDCAFFFQPKFLADFSNIQSMFTGEHLRHIDLYQKQEVCMAAHPSGKLLSFSHSTEHLTSNPNAWRSRLAVASCPGHRSGRCGGEGTPPLPAAPLPHIFCHLFLVSSQNLLSLPSPPFRSSLMLFSLLNVHVTRFAFSPLQCCINIEITDNSLILGFQTGGRGRTNKGKEREIVSLL